jgi:hypothetical protein
VISCGARSQAAGTTARSLALASCSADCFTVASSRQRVSLVGFDPCQTRGRTESNVESDSIDQRRVAKQTRFADLSACSTATPCCKLSLLTCAQCAHSRPRGNQWRVFFNAVDHDTRQRRKGLRFRVICLWPITVPATEDALCRHPLLGTL